MRYSGMPKWKKTAFDTALCSILILWWFRLRSMLVYNDVKSGTPGNKWYLWNACFVWVTKEHGKIVELEMLHNFCCGTLWNFIDQTFIIMQLFLIPFKIEEYR